MTTKEYLQQNANRLDNFIKITKPMHPDCIASIVIPAHNEESSIEKTLLALDNQQNIDLNKIEVIIVVNNTIDKTVENINNFIKSNPKLKYIVIEKNFEKEIAGVGAARKLGCDLAIARNFKRVKPIQDFYLIWLDADNWEIPKDLISEFINMLKVTSIDGVAARTAFNYKELSKDNKLIEMIYKVKLALNSLNKEYNLTPEHIDEHKIDTQGAASGFTQNTYIKVADGLDSKKTREDTYMSESIRAYGGKIARVEKILYVNPRRMLVNPIAWYDHTAWDEETFYKNNEHARNNIVSKSFLTREQIEMVLIDRLNGFAEVIAKRSNGDKEATLKQMRQKFNKYVDIDSYY